MLKVPGEFTDFGDGKIFISWLRAAGICGRVSAVRQYRVSHQETGNLAVLHVVGELCIPQFLCVTKIF